MARRAAVDEAERQGSGSGPQPTAATLEPPAWRGRLAGPLAFIRLAVIGLRRTWPLLAIVSLGMLVAVTLVCTVPVYSDLVSSLQIQRTLNAHPANEVNVEVRALAAGVSATTANTTDHRMDGLVQQYSGGLFGESRRYVETRFQLKLASINGIDPFNPPGHATRLFQEGSQATASGLDIAQAAPHMKLSTGRLPQDTAAGQMPEALIVDQMPNVKLGDTITLRESVDQAVTVRVVGIWSPKDAQDAYWGPQLFDPSSLGALASGTEEPPPVYPIVISRPTFLAAFDIKPQTTNERPIPMTLHYLYFTNHEAITPANLAASADAIKAFRTSVNGNLPGTGGVFSINVVTNLDRLLGQLLQELGLLALPLYVVVAQLVGLALFFVAAMASLLAEGQANVLATLRSRGVSSAQVLAGYALQGALLAALAGLAAPSLAAALSLALVRALVPGAASLAVSASGARYLARAAAPEALALPAAAIAALGVATLVLAALGAARRDVLALRRAEGRGDSTVPFWRRYYLDLVLVGLCAAGYLEFGEFGGLSVRQVLGSTSAANGPDPLLLATPALLLLGGGLLVVRLFPLVARLGARLAARGRGAVGLLTFAQVARVADTASRLVLLLALAVGVGLFALTFRASLARNAADHAAYAVGGDEQVRQVTSSDDQGQTRVRYAQLPGVTGVSALYRSAAGTVDGDFGDAGVLAVDPTDFARVAYWRDDYAAKSLTTLMGALGAHQQPAAPPPSFTGGDPAHPLWALVSASFAASRHVQPGDRFVLAPQESRGGLSFIVGDVVAAFPSLYDQSASDGFIVVGLRDYTSALGHAALSGTTFGPNEYWLRTTADPKAAAARAQALPQVSSAAIITVTARRAQTTQALTSPLNAGMIGLLGVGAAAAAALAIIASVVHGTLAARRRLAQFAILRTLGTSAGQLTRMLLGEQVVVYGCGVLGGGALGLLLTSATLPFLQFGDALASPERVGVPPYVLALDGLGGAQFFAALLLAFALALAISALVAARIGLGRTLRLGED